jgi:hypothetical protein
MCWPNQRLDMVPYRCVIHLDLMTRGALVWLDDDETPIDLEALAPSTGQHPANLMEEDVFSPDLSEPATSSIGAR